MAVGSQDGQVRLYNNASDKSLNRASTAIPGLGLPITDIDITYDGKWVIATTKAYLMVVKTVFRDKNGKETNAFKSRAGGAAPQPRLLRLKLEDNDKTVRVCRCSMANPPPPPPLLCGNQVWSGAAAPQPRPLQPKREDRDRIARILSCMSLQPAEIHSTMAWPMAFWSSSTQAFA